MRFLLFCVNGHCLGQMINKCWIISEIVSLPFSFQVKGILGLAIITHAKMALLYGRISVQNGKAGVNLTFQGSFCRERKRVPFTPLKLWKNGKQQHVVHITLQGKYLYPPCDWLKVLQLNAELFTP